MKELKATPEEGGDCIELHGWLNSYTEVDHFSSEHLYVQTRYRTAYSMSSKGDEGNWRDALITWSNIDAKTDHKLAQSIHCNSNNKAIQTRN